MDIELKHSFTRRVSQSNRTELIVLIYEIYFAYTAQALDELSKDRLLFDRAAYRTAVQKAAEALGSLMEALDMSYELSWKLRSIYDYCRRQIYKAKSVERAEYIEESDKLMTAMMKAFTEVAKQDDSKPLMQNAQTVYAGFTYGKGELNENYIQTENRGFFV